MLIYNDYNNVFLLRLVKQKRWQQRTSVPPTWAILTTLTMHRCGYERIAQYGRSRATLDATGCRHRAINRPVSPRRMPWSSILA
jgi:hypothetical protein